MLKDKELNKGVLIGITSSIIVIYFIEPIISIISEYFILISEALSKEWVNEIYKSASLNFREKTSFIVLLISSYFSIIILLIFLFFVFESSKKKSNEKILEKSIPEGIKRLSKLDLFACLGCAYMFIQILLTCSSSYVEMQVIASFNQRVDAIAYKVEDQEIKKIKAKWANMKSRKDYEEINMYIDNVAVMNDIVIPKPLWN